MERFILSSVLHRLLVALRRHPGWTWLGILAYATAVTLPHDDVQAWVFHLAAWMGRSQLYRIAGGVGIAGAAILTTVVFLRLRDQNTRRILALFWLITIALTFATWRLLTANNTELVHYPQYIPEGMAILALTLSPLESLCWIALFGAIDEDFQYAVLHGTWGVPFDFNDVYMDLMGGAMGVLLAAIFLRCEPAVREPAGAFLKRMAARQGVAMMLSITGCGLLLLASGKMLLFKDPANPNYWFALSRSKPAGFWFFDPTWGPHTFHTLLPLEGPLLMAATLVLFAFLDRRIRILPKP
jgi:hypothetical protein